MIGTEILEISSQAKVGRTWREIIEITLSCLIYSQRTGINLYQKKYWDEEMEDLKYQLLSHYQYPVKENAIYRANL